MSDVRVRIVGDNSSLTSSLASADSSIVGWANKIGGVFKGLAAFAGGAALGGLFKKAIEEAIEGEVGIERLRVAVVNAGGSFENLSPKIEGVVDRLQRTTRATDDELRGALTRMIVTTNDVEGSLRNLSLVTDVAAAGNKSFEDAAVLVGKAMTGNTKALREFGITTSDSDRALKELRASTAGLAEAQTVGLGGALAQIKKQWGEVLEAIGGVITGHEGVESSGNRVADTLANLADWITTNADNIRGFGSAVGSTFGGIRFVLDKAMEGLQLLESLWLTALAAMESVAADFVTGVGFIFKLVGVEAVSDHAAKLRRLSEGHLQEAKDIGNKALGVTKELAQNSVLAWEEAQRTVLTNEQFYGRKRTERVTKDAEDRTKAQEKALEKDRQLLEKYLQQQDKAVVGHLQKLSRQMIDGPAQAAKHLEEALTGALGPLVQAMILRTGDAIDKTLASIKGRIPLEQYERLVQLATDYKNRLIEALPPKEALAESVRKLQEDEKEILATAEAQRRKYLDQVDAVRNVADGFLDLAEATGRVDEDAAHILDNVLQIGASIPKALGGDVSSIVSVFGGLANIIAGLGDSELSRRLREVYSKNTAAVQELSGKVGELALGLPGNQFQGVQEALRAALTAGERAGVDPFDLSKHADVARQTLLKELAKRGITRAEAEEILRTLGIEGVFDPKTLVGFQAIRSALDAMAGAEIGRIGETFAEQFKALQDAFEIFKIEDADDRIAELRKLFSRFSPALKDAFEGIDLGSQEGLGELQTRLQALFKRLLTDKGLSPEELGDLSGGQLIDAIKQLLGLIGGADSVRSFLKPLVGAGGATDGGGGALGAGFPTNREALGGLSLGPTTNIAGGFNVTFNIVPNESMSSQEVAEEVADRLTELFGRRYDLIIASQGSGVATV